MEKYDEDLTTDEIKELASDFDTMVNAKGWKSLGICIEYFKETTQNTLAKQPFQNLGEVGKYQGILEGLEWIPNFVNEIRQRRDEIIEEEKHGKHSTRGK